MSEWEVIARYKSSAPVDIVGAIRDLRIMYREEPMRADQSGYFQKINNFYVIGVNANESPQRKRFTAAHELGHYVYHRDLIQDGQHLDRLFTKNPFLPQDQISPYHEVQANRFAAEMLMPATLVAQKYQFNPDLQEIASEFVVSPSAMQIRLKTLGLMR